MADLTSPITSAGLQRLTVAQLKARCQELGLVGVSKLNKANLVLRILEAAAASAAAAATTSAPEKQASTDNENVGGAHLTAAASNAHAFPGTAGTPVGENANVFGLAPSNGDVDSRNPGAGKKRGRETSRSKTTTAKASSSKRSKKSALTTTTKSAETSSSHLTTIQEPTSTHTITHPPNSPSLTSTHSSLPTHPTIHDNDSAQNQNVKHTKAPSSNRKGAKSARTETAALTKTAPKSTSAAGRPKALIPPRPSSASSGLNTQPAPPLNAKKASSTRTKTANVVSKPLTSLSKFTPLKKVGTVQTVAPKATAKTTFPIVPLEPSPGTVENRVAHIKSHFLHRLFLRLNGTRNPPVLSAPFPAPYTCPNDWNMSLAFPGIHPGVFLACSNADFGVAVRFWIARAHTLFQLGSAQEWSVHALGLPGPDMSRWPPVVSCEKVTSEIHLITTEERALAQPLTDGEASVSHIKIRYLVVASTGDIIASSRFSSDPSLVPEDDYLILGCKVRPDWHSYISAQLDGTMVSPLSAKVKTKDPADFPAGVNRVWATQASSQSVGTDGPARLAVAERVVLMSCMLNSFSGDKLDAMQMESWWLNQNVQPLARPKTSIELYLPESHQVLSVHLPPPPFHPALAIVHRQSGKSDFVLQETGHVVGDEDEGVAELWQGLLGCDYKGNEKDTLDFWKGWEKRARGEEAW